MCGGASKVVRNDRGGKMEWREVGGDGSIEGQKLPVFILGRDAVSELIRDALCLTPFSQGPFGFGFYFYRPTCYTVICGAFANLKGLFQLAGISLNGSAQNGTNGQ